MGPQSVTYFDIAVLGAVSIAVGVTGFVLLLSFGWFYYRSTDKDLKETLRLNRALGSLIVQEAAKIRVLIGR